MAKKYFYYGLGVMLLLLLSCSDINYTDARTISIDKNMVGGRIDIASGGTNFRAGVPVRLKIFAEQGYMFVDGSLAYYVNGVKTSLNDTWFYMPSEDATLTASFTQVLSNVSITLDKEVAFFSSSMRLNPKIFVNGNESKYYTLEWTSSDNRITVEDGLVRSTSDSLIENITITAAIPGSSTKIEAKLTHIPVKTFTLDPTGTVITGLENDLIGTKLYIPDVISNSGITKINEMAFYPGRGDYSITLSNYLTNITEVYIPSSITNIGAAAFKGLPQLLKVFVYSAKPAAGFTDSEPFPVNVFQESGLNAAVGKDGDFQIIVPPDSTEVYKTAPGWLAYDRKIAASKTITITINSRYLAVNGKRDFVYVIPGSFVTVTESIPPGDTGGVQVKLPLRLTTNGISTEDIYGYNFYIRDADITLNADTKKAETLVTLHWQNPGGHKEKIWAQYFSDDGSDNIKLGDDFMRDGTTQTENTFTETPIHVGHTFKGYNTKPDGTGTSYLVKKAGAGSAWKISTATADLYAQWTPDTVTVEFYNDDIDSTPVGSISDVKYGKLMPDLSGTIGMPTKVGYTFNGYWSVKNPVVPSPSPSPVPSPSPSPAPDLQYYDGTLRPVGVSLFTKDNSPVKLYAHWTAVPAPEPTATPTPTATPVPPPAP